MKRISTPITFIKDSYDVVVVGSGYGGSIAASRLARAGQKVCLLERGEEKLPGEYPDTLLKSQREFQINTPARRIGPETGLFDMNVFDDIQVLVGCGLGGTSLINANVSIKPENRIFEDARWPKEIREEFANEKSKLHDGFRAAESMLKPTPFPSKVQLNKLDALERAAKAVNEKMYRTPINVNFDIDGKNQVGVEQKPCNNCGDCCSGCNYSAKNTLLMNYLPDAKNNGAEIYCETKVSHIVKTADGYDVHFHLVGKGAEKFKAPTTFISAKKVVIAAGTLGSTEIMLRSKEAGLDVSAKLGQRFSGNGDVLAFAYNTNSDINGIGSGDSERFKERPVGPCITGVIDAREKNNLEEGMVIEDAAIPGALSAVLSGALGALDSIMGEEVNEDETFKYKLIQGKRKLESLAFGAYHGAVRNTQTFLVMSTDSSKGEMSLEENRLQLKFPGVGGEEIYKLVDEKLKKATAAAQGDFIKNPVWSETLGQNLTTVHPLGGCSMGENYASGVVNHKGQVFSKDGVHEGLYVLDGSILPRAVGVNPLITISALSERACAFIAEENKWLVSKEFLHQDGNVGTETKVGVQFTETMKGFFSKEVKNNDYLKGKELGEDSGDNFKFTLTILSSDVYDMIENPDHTAQMIGTVIEPTLSKEPLSVMNGTFNLFVDDPNNVSTKLMKYRMILNSVEGNDFFFNGFKLVQNQKNKLDMWPDTSTLFITIYKGRDDKGEIVGQGILKIHMADFAKQMTTIKAVNAKSKMEGLKAVSDFGIFFGKSLFDIYGRALVPNKWFDEKAEPRVKRKLKTNDPEYYPLLADDGEELLLTRYKGGEKGPILMLHGFSGNRYTFSIDTIDTNAVEYFYQKGYDVWLLDYRLSSLVGGSKEQHTLDEVALLDFPAAINKIRAVANVEEIDVLAHCVGSIAMFMALMSGVKGVRSMVSAQIAIDFKPQLQVKLKTGLHIPTLLEKLGVDSLSAYTDTSAGFEEKLYNSFIKLYADHTAEFCTDPSCQRMCFMFGPLVEHTQMNDATHKATIEMFGTANITSYKHLSMMIRENKVLKANGADDYCAGIANLSFPITFIHGEKNGLFAVDSTHDTYKRLCEANGENLYQHHIINDYGHNDCMYGKNAVNDVFPLILNHFESVTVLSN
ncbi:MAG: alpha/beta fold hydrolase [Bacteroidetes bacterium]|nr:alpha/beta fold hydrolase [Bacteroidota bacterium]